MRRLSLLLAFGILLSTIAVALNAGPAVGARPPLKCKKVELDGSEFRLCNGRVVSPDATELLDVDVTLPPRGDGPYPLIVMLHGIGGSKSEMESETLEGSGDNFHQNNLWFASRGYAVLTYTTRGYRKKTGELGNECLDPSVEAADAESELYELPSPACLPQLVHKKHEVQDTRHLVGRLVDGTLLSATDVGIRPTRIGVYGRSYGGGHTWILSRINTWRSPEGTKVRVAAAVPIRGWTDLADALAPNGRARSNLMPPTSVSEREAERPGVLKESYVDIFYVALQVRTHGADGQQVPGYLEAWRDRFKQGESYTTDPVVQDALHKVAVNRSAYYIDQKGDFDTAILGVQAFTDHIFGATQAIQMFNRLRTEDPEYPISVYVGDAMGHAIAQNKTEETEYIAGLVNSWFDHYLKGRGPEPASVVEARTTTCAPGLGELYRAPDWLGLQAVDERFELGISGSLLTPAEDPHASELNPIQIQDSNRCRTTDTAVATGNLGAEVVVADGIDMLGVPTVTLDADPSAPEMYVAAHLWDVDPLTGHQTLVDRGVYRLGSDDAQQDVVLQMFGNAYAFAPGHLLKLELTADASPTFRRFSGDGTIAVSNVSITIPEADSSALVP